MTNSSYKEKILRFSFITLALMQCYSSAHAEAESALRPYVDYIILYDDNVLRFTDGAAAQAAIGSDSMSDTAHRLEGGLLFEKKFSQQLVTAKLNLNHTDFNQFNELDHDGGAAQANWNWHVGSHVYGNIGAEYERSLTPFTNFHQLQRNMRDTHREYVNGSWELHPRWRVNGGFAHYGLRYDLASQTPGNRDENTAEIGLDYIAPTESSVGVVLRHTRGTFPDPATVSAVVIDNRYEQNDVFGKIDWRYSVKTRVQFIGGWSERTHDFFPSRNYRGGSARLTARWLPTYKTGVSLSAWREIGSTDNLANSFTLNQGVSVAPRWNVTEKTKLEALVKYETQDYSAASGGFAAANLNRKDTLRYSSLKISYAAMQKLVLAATVYRDELTSNIPRTGYDAHGIWLNARYTF